MPRYFLRFFCFAGLALAVSACGKDDTSVSENPTPAPTLLAINAPAYFGALETPADNPTTVQGVELGRMLFYEKKLSANNTISCGSCHKQEFAFTDGLAFSPGVNGTLGTRSTMSLANSAWFKHYMWDGAATSLEQQARMPIENHLDMNTTLPEVSAKLQATAVYPQKFKLAFGSSNITSENILKALAQFQRTLVSGNSKFDKYLNHTQNLSQLEMEGYKLFRTHPESAIFPPLLGANCGDCHGNTGILALDMFKNNGLDANPTDRGLGAVTGNSYDDFKFKVPTLRNIALTAPYMHDGRFPTLEKVLDHYSDHVKMNSPNLAPDMTATNNPDGVGYGHQLTLTEPQKTAIIAFLHTLTDTSFVNNPAFSDPFEGQ